MTTAQFCTRKHSFRNRSRKKNFESNGPFQAPLVSATQLFQQLWEWHGFDQRSAFRPQIGDHEAHVVVIKKVLTLHSCFGVRHHSASRFLDLRQHSGIRRPCANCLDAKLVLGNVACVAFFDWFLRPPHPAPVPDRSANPSDINTVPFTTALRLRHRPPSSPPCHSTSCQSDPT